jgi:uncharacterized SAM-binding protein YcdF (DUF218 family)
MTALVSVLKIYVLPGTTWFLILGIGLAIVLLYGVRTAAWGRRWLVSLLVLHVTLSVPAVALWMQRLVAGTVSYDEKDATGIDAIVVLGSGVISVGPPEATIHIPSLKTALNITEAARRYATLGRPRIIASGGIPRVGVGRRAEGEVIRDHLLALGVLPRDITVEAKSTTTVEQAANVSALLPPASRVLLVAVPLHMPRAEALFRARGLDVVPAASAPMVEGSSEAPNPFVPSPYALRASADAVHEMLGLVYYRLRGDIRPYRERS